MPVKNIFPEETVFANIKYIGTKWSFYKTIVKYNNMSLLFYYRVKYDCVISVYFLWKTLNKSGCKS